MGLSVSVFLHGFLYLPFLGVPAACAPRLACVLPGLAIQRNDLLHPSTRRVPHRRPFCKSVAGAVCRRPIRRFCVPNCQVSTLALEGRAANW